MMKVFYTLRWIFTLLFLSCRIFVFGQTEEQKNNIIEQRIEIIASNQDESSNIDYTTLLEDLNFLFEHPLNLNNATRLELQELNMLDDIQISQLQRHIAKYGSLKTIYELQAVEGFDMTTIRLIEPFVTVKPASALEKVSLKTILKEGQNDLFFRYKRVMEDQGGFIPDPDTGKPAFVGSPDYMYTRYRMQFRKNLSIGITMEKDAGETLKTGPDFTSFHAGYFSNTGVIRKLVVGDFQTLFGQGLTFWNGLGFGKSPFVMNVKKNALGLKAYTSVQEGMFLRGAGTTLGFGKFDLTLFYSSKKIDASEVTTQDTTITDDQSFVSSLIIGGYHRTESEIAKRKNLGERIYGGNLNFRYKTLSIGTTAVRTEFDQNIQASETLYQQYRFSGKTNLNLGVDYQYVFRNAQFFGEVSRSQNGGMAAVNGIVAALHPRLSVSMVHRNYGKDYQNLHASTFGENNTTGANEKGLFMGLQSSLNGKWTFTGYVDLVSFPWLRFRVDGPSRFSDFLAQFNYKPDRKNEFYLRYRHRSNEQNSSLNDIITSPVAIIQDNVRFHGVYQVHPNIQMKSRAEWTRFGKEGDYSNGFLLYQDLIFKKLNSPLTASVRYALFDTKDWNSRLYAFESDVLYAFSIPPYYGKGSRFYAMIKYDLFKGVDLWVRYGAWIYTDRNVISSGSSEISGNKKSDVHIQLRWQF
jgi:hypothetical protein